MNIKIKYHFMPWEIDYAMLTFMQLKKASYYLDADDTLYVDSALNLSSYLIDWEASQLSKEFFVTKYKHMSSYLNFANHKSFVYDGDEVWGHLDLERAQQQDDIDYYMSICPDIYFHPTTLGYIIEAAKQCKNDYFVITTQTQKLWDSTWDVLVNPGFDEVPHELWDKIDPFDSIAAIDSNDLAPSLTPLQTFKYAGWFDLYSKSYVEDLVPIPDHWRGYGPWDTFGMFAAAEASKHVDVKQYLLNNQIVCDLATGPNKLLNPSTVYRSMIVRKDVPDQREQIERNFSNDLNNWYKNFISNLK